LDGVVAAERQAQRKDAYRNREAILKAARELFAESDDVPMYEIGRRAGVGQATLYRNFPERSAIMGALLSELMDHMEEVGADLADDPDAFFVLLRDLVEAQVSLQGLVDGLHAARAEESEVKPLRDRLARLLRRPLRDAKAAGTIRRDVNMDDVFLVMSMVGGAIAKATGPSGKAAAAARARTLIVEGLSPSATGPGAPAS